MAFLLFVLALGLAGCTRSGIQVIPRGSSRGVLDLSSDDIVTIMWQAGFSNEQILEHGTAVRDGLAQSGAVYIRMNRKVEVVFVVNDRDIYISTRMRGIFIYNVDTGWVSGENTAR